MISTSPDTIAWMNSGDGRIAFGYGPFESTQTPPESGCAFYMNDFGLADPAPWKIPQRWELLAPDAAAKKFPAPAANVAWEPVEAVPFSDIFQKSMECIHAGDFEKIVPVVTERGTSDGNPGKKFLAASIHHGPPLVAYGIDDCAGGFAGATPEWLFSLHGDGLQTMALAGTARAEDHEVFAADEKEIREHEYVAHTLVSKLAHLGHVTRHPRDILNLGSIVHFHTRIDVTPRVRPDENELVNLLHPTPALGILPRTPENLATLIGWRRKLECPDTFGAPFGLWLDGQFNAVVAIRGIWWRENSIFLPAGCGLIEASRLVNEWRELRLKREAVKHFMAIHGPPK
ncbi:MAG: chorismate-binding protein [Verrucomicrobiota bacterium]